MRDSLWHSLCLNIRSESPYAVHKKEPTSSVGGKKKAITGNK